MTRGERMLKDTHEARIKQCAGDPPHYLIAYISYGDPDDCPLCKALKPLPTLEEIAKAVLKAFKDREEQNYVSGEFGIKDVIIDGHFNLLDIATAILDLLKGER